MTAATSLSAFCQWLLAEQQRPLATCAIILHGDRSAITDQLIDAIAQYLNEYDDDADGPWLGATDLLITKAGSDPSHRRLLGLPDIKADEVASASEQFTATLNALGKKGHTVLRWPEQPWENPSPAHTFHAGVGNMHAISERCHIVIDPSLVASSSIPHIIGDVFMEWMVSGRTHASFFPSVR